MSRLAAQVHDYFEGLLPDAELDEMLFDLAHRVLDAQIPVPGAPALVVPPGEPAPSVAAGIVEEELDRVSRLVSAAELERLCDQVSHLLGAVPRTPDSLGRFTSPRPSPNAPEVAGVAALLMDAAPAEMDAFTLSAEREETEAGSPRLSMMALDELEAPGAGATAAAPPGAPAPEPLPASAPAPAPAPAPPSRPSLAQADVVSKRAAPRVFGSVDAPPAPPAMPPAPPPPPESPAPRARATRSTAAFREASVARSVSTSITAASGGGDGNLPAVRGRPAVSLAVDGAVPIGVVLLLIRAAYLLVTAGTPVTGGLAWTIAAIAYAGRAERLRADPESRGAGGSALGSLSCALMALLTLLK